ncbi:MAG TPA: GNAT family N-acetyltransferase [Candidatus Acidoferrum sp.]|nr:GNAT family N-acetyltransferase [Candidatus Acidoferrum sp.]
MDLIAIRPYKVGEASYICYLQMELYDRVYGFKPVFEYYLLAGAAKFLADTEGGQIWVAVDGEKVIGSIAIVKAGEDTAQLRWFALDDRYHGKGLGKKLMDAAMGFCREQGYKQVYLWTVDILYAARHLYEVYGFKLTDTKPNNEWTDSLLTEERWDITL